MRVLVAPSGFKDALPPSSVAAAITAGVRRASRHVTVETIPVPDGGEETAVLLAQATGGSVVGPVEVTGPLGRPVTAHYAILGGPGPRTVAVDAASAAGLTLIPSAQRNPEVTTSFGVGELIAAALSHSPERILVCCGDSGVCDGGAGALQALGVRLYDRRGIDLPWGGAALGELDRVEASTLDPRLRGVDVDAAINAHSLLCGPVGAAHVFGPQKGGRPDQILRLSQAMDRWALILARDLPETATGLGHSPGAGAFGGLGAGLAAIGARLIPRFDVLLAFIDIEGPLSRADLVITAEGTLDAQSFPGKVPAEVARRAEQYGCPVLVLAGNVGPEWRSAGPLARRSGVSACLSVLPGPMTQSDAMAATENLLVDAAAAAVRLVLAGAGMPRPG